MGFGNISVWQLLILLLIVVLVFGTKKIRNIGGDLGSAIRDFRKGMNESDDEDGAEAEAAMKSEAAETEESPGPADSQAPKS